VSFQSFAGRKIFLLFSSGAETANSNRYRRRSIEEYARDLVESAPVSGIARGAYFSVAFHRASRLRTRCARPRREEARRSTPDRERRRRAEGFGTLGHKVLGRRRAMKDHSVDCYFRKRKVT
jgi:hypothetical protein